MILPQQPPFSLQGQRALVTGASSGIGLAAAVALANAGADVICVARRTAPLEQVTSAITKTGGKATALAADITDLTALARLFEEGPFDVVVNAAGLARHSPATETTPADFDAVASLNIRSAYFLAQYAAKAMIASGKGGSIIQISSQMGHVGGPDRAVYCATKHAVEGMTKAMALEWGEHGIRVNTICPTFIRTPLTESTFTDPEKRAWLMGRIAVGRPGLPEDIMGAVLFLASAASALVTGSALKVDGGWTAA